MRDDVVEAIVACRFDQDPPDALLIEGIHTLCVDLLHPDKKYPWTPDGQRVSLANLGGLWLDGGTFRLAIKERPRWSSAMHQRGFAWDLVFRDAFAMRLWSRASQAFTAKTCRAARILAPHMVPKVAAPQRYKQVKLVGLPIEIGARGRAPVIAPPPERPKPAIPRQIYFLLNIAVNAGEFSGWQGIFRSQGRGVSQVNLHGKLASLAGRPGPRTGGSASPGMGALVALQVGLH